MPRPTDDAGDDHRGAIAALKKAQEHNEARLDSIRETIANAQQIIRTHERDREELDRQQAALQRGIDALKEADQ
jgi:exonuclease VII small subunit